MGKRDKEQTRKRRPAFLAENDDAAGASSKKRSKAPKQHQKQEELISSGMSSKILKQALLQQKELLEEEDEAEGSNLNEAFALVEEDDRKQEDEDEDEFGGFSETQSQFGNFELLNVSDGEIDEDDEKLLEAFFLKNAGPQQTLADLIIQKIKDKDEKNVAEATLLPNLDHSIVELYRKVGKSLEKYTAGRFPNAFKRIPSMKLWEDIVYLTEPVKWSPNAMHQATRIFASNLSANKAARFYRLVLLPRVRDDIKRNKSLHFALHQSLKKAVYKPAAFNKGILFPLCESGTCSLREALIVGSIIKKVSIPVLHSGCALMMLAQMEYCGTTSYFIKLLLEKKYALPYRVVDALVAHFMNFIDDTRTMPVIWQQSLLAFVQRYKHELRKEDKDNLRSLLEKQNHKLVTPEILREIDSSRSRGEKEDRILPSPVSVINKTIEEDRFDIPDVPMEED